MLESTGLIDCIRLADAVRPWTGLAHGAAIDDQRMVDGRQEIKRTLGSIEIAFVAGGMAEMVAIGAGKGREGAETGGHGHRLGREVALGEQLAGPLWKRSSCGL